MCVIYSSFRLWGFRACFSLQEQHSAAYSEHVIMLSCNWEAIKPRESQSSKLDERFLSGPNSRPELRKLPFFSDLHREISRSRKQHFSSRLTNAAFACRAPRAADRDLFGREIWGADGAFAFMGDPKAASRSLFREQGLCEYPETFS